MCSTPLRNAASIERLADAVDAMYPGLRDVTFVTIEEVEEGDWGIGGQAITAQKVAAHAENNRESVA